MTWWTVAWMCWIVAFAIIEGFALADKRPGDTFSEHIWLWFKVKDQRNTAATWFARAPLYVVLTWLVGHLAFGWWTL